MARCFNIEECEDMIKKIKEAQKEHPEGFRGLLYNYWCSCSSCHCDNDS